VLISGGFTPSGAFVFLKSRAKLRCNEDLKAFRPGTSAECEAFGRRLARSLRSFDVLATRRERRRVCPDPELVTPASSSSEALESQSSHAYLVC